MSKTDDLVNAWIKKKFLESVQYQNNSLRYGPPEQITVLSADVDPYCGCYSEYTRDDGFEMVARLTSKFVKLAERGGFDEGIIWEGNES